MQSFIVLGIIPGTNFQLNFSFWISTGIIFVCLPMLRKIWQNRTYFLTLLAAFRIARVIDQYQLLA